LALAEPLSHEELLSLVVTLMPSFLFSGFLFPIATMPYMLQLYTYFFPARYFNDISRDLFLKGVGPGALVTEAAFPESCAICIVSVVCRTSCTPAIRTSAAVTAIGQAMRRNHDGRAKPRVTRRPPSVAVLRSSPRGDEVDARQRREVDVADVGMLNGPREALGEQGAPEVVSLDLPCRSPARPLKAKVEQPDA